MPFRVTFFAAHAIICIIMVYLEKEEQILEFLHLNATFGRLEQHELHLHSGLNLICAPNESGKSTWGSFICAMLYGLSTRDRGLMADKNRFAPWSGAAMQGRMDILSDGRALTLQRDTRRANAPMGNFSCTYTGTGTPVEGITAQNAGEQLLGVPRDVWERSAFIGQNALAVSQSAELERRISSLITTGEEDASFTESYERLKKQLNRRKHNKTGQIPVLERDIAQLHQSLQELDALEQQARQAQEEVSALTQQVDGLRHQAAQQQAQIRQERINAWHRAARTAEEAQRRADILAEAAAPLPDDAALSLLEGQAAALQSDMAALTGQRSAANEARTAAAEAHAVWEAHPLYPDDAAALERRAASIAPPRPRPCCCPPPMDCCWQSAPYWLWCSAPPHPSAGSSPVWLCWPRRSPYSPSACAAVPSGRSRSGWIVIVPLWQSRQPRTCPSATAPPRPTKPPAAPAPSFPVPRRAAAAAC